MNRQASFGSGAGMAGGTFWATVVSLSTKIQGGLPQEADPDKLTQSVWCNKSKTTYYHNNSCFPKNNNAANNANQYY